MESKIINGFEHLKFEPSQFSEQDMLGRSLANYEWHNKRRSVREISSKPFPREVLDNIIRTASTAPSGAHKQPWTFCIIESPDIKRKIREAAEEEEKTSYESRMSDQWLEDLKPFDTNWKKPFLTKAPYLVVVFRRAYDLIKGEKVNNYYVNESVGIACGMLISAIHYAGLVTLTHTPNPMNFLSKVLDRPKNERPFLLMPVGYAESDAYVPNLKRKDLNELIANY